MKIILEVKIYVLLMLTTCLLLMVREQVGIKIFSTYILASIFGIKSIGCFITGKCYQEVYFFLITYSIINFAVVFYYQELKQLFEDTYNKIRDNK